jgi:hypothetical protein
MAKNSIRDYSKTAASNTDVQNQNIDEGCSPAKINNAIREVMADLADVNDGTISLVSPDFNSATLGVSPDAGRSIDAFPSGTKMLFQQTAAPVGWLKDTTHNDKALRITNGTVGTGGSVAFETAFASQTPAGTITVNVEPHAITALQMPAHTHTILNNIYSKASHVDSLTGGDSNVGVSSQETESKGGSQTHGHEGSTGTFTGTAMNLDVQYVDIIIATKV